MNPLANVVIKVMTPGRRLTPPTFIANGSPISSTQVRAPIGSDKRLRCGMGDLEVIVLMAPATSPIATALGTLG